MHGLVNQSCSLPYGRRCNSENESQPRSDNTGYILRRNRGGLGCWRISYAAEKRLHLFSNSTCHPNMCNRLETRTNERFMQSRKVFRGKYVVLLQGFWIMNVPGCMIRNPWSSVLNRRDRYGLPVWPALGHARYLAELSSQFFTHLTQTNLNSDVIYVK